MLLPRPPVCSENSNIFLIKSINPIESHPLLLPLSLHVGVHPHLHHHLHLGKELEMDKSSILCTKHVIRVGPLAFQGL